MPDWTYQPVLRPWLFLQAPERARDFTLAALERLGAGKVGRTLIRAMGHMTPPEEVCVRTMGIEFPSAVGLGAGLDVNGQAAEAFALFGVGFIEVGPVSEQPIEDEEQLQRWQQQEALGYPSQRSNSGATALVDRLQGQRSRRVPIGVRLGGEAENHCRLIEQLRGVAAFFSIEADDVMTVEQLKAVTEQAGAIPVLLVIHPDQALTVKQERIETALQSGIAGILLDDSIYNAAQDCRVISPAVQEECLRLVRWLRTTWHDVPIIAGGGIHDPAAGLALLQAGATLVSIHSGLVFTGPGLPKRINEAVAYYAPRQPIPLIQPTRTLGLTSWKWLAFAAASLLYAGLLIWLVAITRVILPYDEAFVQMTLEQLAALSPNLLPFMAHDRVSFTGVVIASALLMFGTAFYAIRRQVHWAQQAVKISCAVGVSTFFLFLGFGYLDPLHALLTAGLVPAFIFSVRGKTRVYAATTPPSLYNDVAWRRANWGQLFFTVMGLGLFGGGLAIVVVGVTTVFVPQDLAFMKVAADALRLANPRLLPLIAHDRVGFGGSLISTGLLTAFLALWGFRRGERWLWWTLVIGGIPGVISAIGTHFAVGYTDFIHLSPVYLALVLYVLGAVLTYPYLCGQGAKEEVGYQGNA